MDVFSSKHWNIARSTDREPLVRNIGAEPPGTVKLNTVIGLERTTIVSWCKNYFFFTFLKRTYRDVLHGSWNYEDHYRNTRRDRRKRNLRANVLKVLFESSFSAKFCGSRSLQWQFHTIYRDLRRSTKWRTLVPGNVHIENPKEGRRTLERAMLDKLNEK